MFCEMSLNWDSSDVFLMIYQGDRIWGGRALLVTSRHLSTIYDCGVHPIASVRSSTAHSLPLLCKPPSCSAQPTPGCQLIGLVSVPVTAQQPVVP